MPYGKAIEGEMPGVQGLRGPENENGGKMTGGEAILLIDDEGPILEFGKEILDYHGYQTLTAENGEKAVELFSREKEHIALVILDLNMPGIDGQECLRRILEIEPKTKVVIASGYSSSDTVQEMMKMGASGFFMKPFKFDEMVNKVREILAGT
jgi:two-component system cell cycle sensor histidine kinase/response regulator CckA